MANKIEHRPEKPDDEAEVVEDLSWGKGYDEFTRDHATQTKVLALKDGVVVRFTDPPRPDPDPSKYRAHSLCIEMILGPKAAQALLEQLEIELEGRYLSDTTTTK